MPAWNARSTGERRPAIPAGLYSWCIGSWHTHTLTAPCLTSRTAGGSVLVSHLYFIQLTRNIASRLSRHSELTLSGLYPTSLKRLAYRLGELLFHPMHLANALCSHLAVTPWGPTGLPVQECTAGIPPSPVPL